MIDSSRDASLLADLAAALSTVRRQRGLRQADVAAKMGTSQSCVSDFERAKSNPELAFVARYAAAVGVELRFEVALEAGPPSRAVSSPASLRLGTLPQRERVGVGTANPPPVGASAEHNEAGEGARGEAMS